MSDLVEGRFLIKECYVNVTIVFNLVVHGFLHIEYRSQTAKVSLKPVLLITWKIDMP